MISETWSWYTSLALIFSIAVITISSWLINKSRTKGKTRLPPGPRGLPLVGSLPFLKPDLHSYFAQLASTYGPILKIKLGSKLCVVISSSSVAKEVLKDHDTNFADRDTPAVVSVVTYGGTDMIWSPYGEHWRMLRKLCVREILNHGRLESFYGLRRKEVRHMVSQIFSKVGKPINIGEQIVETMWNIMASTIWGSTLDGDDMSRVIKEYVLAQRKMAELVNEPNVSDIFPSLARFDIQGKERRMKKYKVWFDQIFDGIIAKRREMERKQELKKHDKESKDFLQVLLQLVDQGDQKTPFTVTHLKAILLDMTFAGTATTSTTVEWAMAELMKQPKIMKKIQEELQEVVGTNNVMEESHLPKLHYLDSVVKEVFRIHPAVPLLVPRRARESSIIGGYEVPKGAQVLVNAWAIQRDPEYWDNPLEFRPERFLNSTIEWDYNGNDFRYIPFGSGRRVCVGIPLAERLVPYLLASLLHSFNWELPEGTELDLLETFRIELKKKTPIIAIPGPRLPNSELYA